MKKKKGFLILVVLSGVLDNTITLFSQKLEKRFLAKKLEDIIDFDLKVGEIVSRIVKKDLEFSETANSVGN